jgi:hypothetical protein
MIAVARFQLLHHSPEITGKKEPGYIKQPGKGMGQIFGR